MPLSDWRVIFAKPCSFDMPMEFKEFATNVSALTEDGAIGHASKEFKDTFGRLPHEEEILKVENLASA